MSRRPWAGLVLAAALVAGGCGSADGGVSERIRHGEGDGPLSVHSAEGSMAVNVHDRPPWKVSYGLFLLCSRDGQRIDVEDVRFETAPEPLAIEPWFREIPGEEERAGKHVTWTPFISLPGVHGAYTDGTVAGGTFSRELTHAITQPCGEVDRPGVALTELVTEMTVGERGAWVRETNIDYRVGDRRYTLEVDWQNIACGVAIRTAECPPASRRPPRAQPADQ